MNQKRNNDELLTTVFGSKEVLEPAPTDVIPQGMMRPEIAYQIVKDEKMCIRDRVVAGHFEIQFCQPSDGLAAVDPLREAYLHFGLVAQYVGHLIQRGVLVRIEGELQRIDLDAVSYTHLDVYKRQGYDFNCNGICLVVR